MLRVPLAVRLYSTAGDKHVTRRVHDLSFRKTVPGGYASASIEFDQPLETNDSAVASYGKLYVYDGRSGATVWEGRQEDPGRAADQDGQVWSLNAFGPAVHVEDRQITVCYAENGLEAWKTTSSGIRATQLDLTDDDPPRLKVGVPDGTVVGATSAIGLNRIVKDCGQKLARVSIAWDAGKTDSDYTVDIRTRPTMAGTVTAAKSAAMNSGGGTLTAVITTDIPSGDAIVDFRMVHTGSASTIVDSKHWISGTPVIQGTRYTRAGVEQTTGATYAANTVLASDVVADLLGRVLTSFDGTNATIDVNSYAIDRLVYPDPTTPGQILEDLMRLESGYFWAAWESTSTGKARFVWQAWPTAVRYETSITGGFDSPGDLGDLYNAVLVRYRDANGRTRSVRRTLAQTDLDNASLTREAVIDLGDNIGSAANAAQVGDRFLADHNYIPNAGTLTVSTPILDRLRGRMVAPWEIEPGSLIRVRGVLPRSDALNATTRDAVTVFRLTATEYKASTNSATLELDSPPKTDVDQLVEALKRIKRVRKR